MPPRSTVDFQFGEVRGVAVSCQDHVAGVVGDDGIILSGCVIDKLFHLLNFVRSILAALTLVPRAVLIVSSSFWPQKQGEQG